MKNKEKEHFFNLVATYSGTDPDTSRKVFYGLIKTISKDLKDGREAKLPDWGKFFLKLHQSKRILNVNTKQISFARPRVIIKFKPENKVRKHFYKLHE